MKLTTAAFTALLVTFAAAVPEPAALDHGAIAKALRERSLDAVLKKRCDYDFYETCMGTCTNDPGCPGCGIGCVIGCCGSTQCC